MTLSGSWRKWSRLPSRIALLFGIGALSAAGAQANTPEGSAADGRIRMPLQSAKSFGDVLMWSDSGRIYVSEAGRPAEQLHLSDTEEARRLHEMLARAGAAPGSPSTVPHRMILAGSGGDGFHRASTPAETTAPPGSAGTDRGQKSAAPTGRSPKPPTRSPRDATARNAATKG